MEADMASDEALWALYERWCKAFNQERQPDEMARRFSKFKEVVLRGWTGTTKPIFPPNLG